MPKTSSKCCVLGCPSTPPHFKFPTNRALVRKWLAVLSPHCDPKMSLSSRSVCSRHFLSEDWESARGRARLQRAAIPRVTDEKPETDANQTEDSPDTNNKNENEDTESANSSDTNHSEDETLSNYIQKYTKSPQIDSDDSQKETTIDKDKNVKRDRKKKKKVRKESEKKEVNGIDKGLERVQENDSKDTADVDMECSGLDNKKNDDKCKESTPKLPSGPRDIDKDRIEDIEELLTSHHIKQNNIHGAETADDTATVEEMVSIEIEPEADPVFIEISVDKDSTAPGDKNDCLMVLESVQVDIDPSSLMLPEREDLHQEPVETLEIEEDPPNEKADPISLLTSSDEDDVIIQEPHIDTVEVSDETDEDDMPLVKLLRKRRAEKKKNARNKMEKKQPSIPQIAAWNIYEYYCVQCHYKTSSSSDYRKHMAGHAKVILMCQLCGYMTASSTQFAKHEKQHGEKIYKCDLCDFKAKRNISLVYHMKTHKHSAKEFKCGECDFVAFSDQSILRHIKYCSDSRRFQCDKCEYATKKKSDLRRHKSKRHDDEDNDADYVPPPGCRD